MKKIFRILKSHYKNNYKIYFIIIWVIFLGLLTRKIYFIPYFLWDILRWIMMFFIVLLFTKNIFKVLLLSLIICISIECSQLFSYDFLIEVRNTKLGWILLWIWFLYSDILAYMLWIMISYFSLKPLKKIELI